MKLLAHLAKNPRKMQGWLFCDASGAQGRALKVPARAGIPRQSLGTRKESGRNAGLKSCNFYAPYGSLWKKQGENDGFRFPPYGLKNTLYRGNNPTNGNEGVQMAAAGMRMETCVRRRTP